MQLVRIFYPLTNLVDGVTPEERSSPPAFDWPARNVPIKFVNISGPESKVGKSSKNDSEAHALLNEGSKLLAAAVPAKNLAFLSVYRGQVSQMRAMVANDARYRGAVFATTESFQGFLFI